MSQKFDRWKKLPIISLSLKAFKKLDGKYQTLSKKLNQCSSSLNRFRPSLSLMSSRSSKRLNFSLNLRKMTLWVKKAKKLKKMDLHQDMNQKKEKKMDKFVKMKIFGERISFMIEEVNLSKELDPIPITLKLSKESVDFMSILSIIRDQSTILIILINLQCIPRIIRLTTIRFIHLYKIPTIFKICHIEASILTLNWITFQTQIKGMFPQEK